MNVRYDVFYDKLSVSLLIRVRSFLKKANLIDSY